MNNKVNSYCVAPISIKNIIDEGKMVPASLEVFANENLHIRMLPDEKIHHNVMVRDCFEVGMSFKEAKTGDIHSGLLIFNEDVAKGSIDYIQHLYNSAMPVEKVIRKEAQRVLNKIKKATFA